MEAMRAVAWLPVALVLAVVGPAGASQPNMDGWARFGRAVAEGHNDAYERGRIRALELQALEAQAREARQKEWLAASEDHWRSILVTAWTALGLPGQEAAAVAKTFKLDVQKQDAMEARVVRHGVSTAVAAATQAYDEYNYQLANELLVAAFIVNRRAVESSP